MTLEHFILSMLYEACAEYRASHLHTMTDAEWNACMSRASVVGRYLAAQEGYL